MQKLKPKTIYHVDDIPPIIDLILMACQHLVKFGLLIILPIWLLKTAHAPYSELTNFISITLIGSAIATLLMTRKKFIGAYCFIPAITSVSYFACLYTIAKQGKVSQILGAAIIIAISQIIASFLIPLVKRFLTINIAGLGLFGLGIWAAVLGVNEFFHPAGLGEVISHGMMTSSQIVPSATLLGLVTLLIMLVCLFISRLSSISILIGMVIGWIIGNIFGFLPSGNSALFQQAPWFHFPNFFHQITFNFTWQQTIMFILVGIYASFICFSLITIITHENDQNWLIHYHQRSFKGNLAAGLGALISSLLGGSPATPINGAVGDMITTRAYSRYIAYVLSLILFIIAFFPKLFFILVTIPAAANGAAIILMGGMMCTKGLSLISFKNLSPEEMKAFPYAMLFLVVTEISPNFYNQSFLKYFTTSNLVVGMVTFILLSLFFSIRKLYGKR